ncbi:hypothetical protein RHMOL_Rhmol08G0204400 [Rhododendron molle]|uniref:Uncharacterized protein n=2 Tax=Rhododendron molle TaxID=49168 RepID=A0ACC0MQS7_RHOML|nr:hypothetical protein RHMOL_Rhmol08G0204400 [Rhododendron molle]KAI8543280.1 hypothetical protein RHMOL_Rhmol08G0204400 [Rhododendron molle]
MVVKMMKWRPWPPLLSKKYESLGYDILGQLEITTGGKTEVHAIFMQASEELSLCNIQDLFDAADYSLSLLRKGAIPKFIHSVEFLIIS